MQAVRNFADTYLADRMKVLWYTWMLIQVLLFCLVISCCAAANVSESVPYGFVAVWSALLALGYSVGGTLVLRRIEYRTPLAVGFLLGVGVMMINLMIVLAVMSGGNAAMFSKDAVKLPAVGAVEAFAWMLILSYCAFTAFLAAYKDTLLPPPMSTQDHDQGLPPAQTFTTVDAGGFSGAGAGYAGESYRDTQPQLAAPGGGASVL